MMELIRAWAAKLFVFASGLGGPGVFLVAVADSSFLSIPEGNDLLIIALSIGQGWTRMIYLVAMTIAGSVLGCTLLYTVGRRGGPLLERMAKGRLKQAQLKYQKHGLWTILVACVVPPPMPFKIFVLSAGLLGVTFGRFFLAVLVGRSVRYFTWGILAVLFGQSAKLYLEQNLRLMGTLLLVFAIILTLGYLLFRRKAVEPLIRDDSL